MSGQWMWCRAVLQPPCRGSCTPLTPLSPVCPDTRPLTACTFLSLSSAVVVAARCTATINLVCFCLSSCYVVSRALFVLNFSSIAKEY